MCSITYKLYFSPYLTYILLKIKFPNYLSFQATVVYTQWGLVCLPNFLEVEKAGVAFFFCGLLLL